MEHKIKQKITRIWRNQNTMSFWASCEFWCPCTILPHFVIESGLKAFMETEKFQLFTRFEFPSYVSIKSKLRCPPADKPLGIWPFKHRFMQIPSSSSRQNCSNTPPTQLFRKRQIRQPWLSNPRPNLRWKDLTLSVQTPHPSQAKVQIP